MPDANNSTSCADPALDDGRHDLDDARHRRRHGGIAGRLSSAPVNSPSAGDRHSDPGRSSFHKPETEYASRLPRHDVAHGASRGKGVRIPDVRSDVRVAASRLGDALGRALPDCVVRIDLPSLDPSAEFGAVLGAAADAHGACVSLFRDVHRALRGDLVPYAGRKRRIAEADGSLEYRADNPPNLVSAARPK